ncbi:MAG: LON peptidase substrate-binding domain-containing protein, partial [bacterium]
FPLTKVLFPHMILPLHIFEERYKTMVADLQESDGVFGVVHSDEVHSGMVGTTARIQRILHTYEDGRIDLIAVGEERFRLLDFVEDSPYLVAQIKPVEDIRTSIPAKTQINSMLVLYRQFISRLGLESEQREQLESLVEEMTAEQDLSYIIGQTIGLDSGRQQELLEVVSPGERVRLLTGELLRQDTVHHLARKLFEGSDFDPGVN